jgi:hypothetical protein|tara:strand:+ start:625 stop:825 length:201 start_codon:yes stop_codon:yes gene_type:complete
MSKFKIGDTVEYNEGASFGVVHDVSANGSKYLVDDDTDFSWFKEEELVLVEDDTEFQFKSPDLFRM